MTQTQVIAKLGRIHSYLCETRPRNDGAAERARNEISAARSRVRIDHIWAKANLREARKHGEKCVNILRAGFHPLTGEISRFDATNAIRHATLAAHSANRSSACAHLEAALWLTS